MNDVDADMRLVSGVAEAKVEAACPLTPNADVRPALGDLLCADVYRLPSGLSVSMPPCNVRVYAKVEHYDGEIPVNYLEIEPTILWVYPDFERDNRVYSNTTWNVN